MATRQNIIDLLTIISAIIAISGPILYIWKGHNIRIWSRNKWYKILYLFGLRETTATQFPDFKNKECKKTNPDNNFLNKN